MINKLLNNIKKLFSKCNHEWEIIYVNRRSLVPTERRCKKCQTYQIRQDLWINKK